MRCLNWIEHLSSSAARKVSYKTQLCHGYCRPLFHDAKAFPRFSILVVAVKFCQYLSWYFIEKDLIFIHFSFTNSPSLNIGLSSTHPFLRKKILSASVIFQILCGTLLSKHRRQNLILNHYRTRC